MGRTFLLTAALTAVLFVPSVSAQTAFRCDLNGQAVYRDTPCPLGSAATAIAPTQETAAQKAAAQKAKDDLRKDTAYVDKRLDDRYKRDTNRPVAKEATTVAVKDKATRKASKSTKVKGSGSGSGKAKKTKSSSAKASRKKDNRSARGTP